MRSTVAKGAGVAIMSDTVYCPWSLEGDRIEARKVADRALPMDVGLAWRRTSKLNACAPSFRDFCHNTCNASGGPAS